MTAPFCYELPPERIAQRPTRPYDQAKMLVIDRNAGAFKHSQFSEIASFLRPEDLLVFNNTKVLPARLFGAFAGEGGQVEILLLEQRAAESWVCLGRPLKRFTTNRILEFSNSVRAQVLERLNAHNVLLKFSVADGLNLHEQLRLSGVMPIPPYIRRGVGDIADVDDYQTFFAQHEGSVAAPTASLHFTPKVFAAIKQAGCDVAYVTLHLGTASFLALWSVGEEAQPPARPGEERGFFDGELLRTAKAAKAKGGRVIAVGTSVVRLLETIVRSGASRTGIQEVRSDLFIEPGFDFKLVDALVTNFHQPRTTHLLLVQAFMGGELLQSTYDSALMSDYRFLSYGDGMLII